MECFDILIVGGGVIGSAIARELSKYKLKIGVLEKNPDVCMETSGRNSGVVHGGFAYDPGSLKARLCKEGNAMMDELSDELDFPFLRCGKLLVGKTEEDRASLAHTMQQGKENGVTDLRMIEKEELNKLVPMAIGEFAMFSPSSGILDPFQYTVALAENAQANGVSWLLEHEVTQIERTCDNRWLIHTSKGIFSSRWMINSAGLGCGRISEMMGLPSYRVIGSKGEYIIMDKSCGTGLPMPVYPVPSNTYMGIHVTNTIDGNVLIGPNAELTMDFEDYGVDGDHLTMLEKEAAKIWSGVDRRKNIRNYAGILPKWVDEQGRIQDFKIEILDHIAPQAVNLVGMESPGLTAAVPIARYVVEQIKAREALAENPDFNPRRVGITRFTALSLEEKQKLIAQNPDYGEIICRCEKVTKAEILQAIHNPLGVTCLTGIKYRTRAMMGRCQGGYCQMRITKMLQDEQKKEAEEIMYAKEGSWMFAGTVRKEER